MANLERQGVIGELETLLRSDVGLLDHFRGDHERYRDQRWAMLSPEHRAIVESSPSLLKTFRGGIAGIADFATIKCLHAHVAHHLADPQGNIVARLLIERHGLRL